MQFCARLILLISVVLFSSACSRGETEVYRAEEYREENTPLIENPEPFHDGPIFNIKKDLVLGVGDTGPDWQLFATWPQLLVGPDGTIVLGDSRRSEIFIVESDGSLRARFGGEGSGPGEFQNLWYMHWAHWGEEFWVEDQQLNRVSKFNMEGEYLNSFNYTQVRMRFDVIQGFGDGRWLAKAFANPFQSEQYDEYAFLDGEFKMEAGFIRLRGNEILVEGRNGIPKPFRGAESAMPIWGTDRILVSRPKIGILTVYSTSGRPLFRFYRRWEVSPVTQADITSWKNSRRSRYPDQILDKMDFPDQRPFFAHSLVDEQGRIWVRRSRQPRAVSHDETSPSVIVDVFRPSGHWIGTQTLPFRSYMVYGDCFYVTPFGEEVPRLERYTIEWLIDWTADHSQ